MTPAERRAAVLAAINSYAPPPPPAAVHELYPPGAVDPSERLSLPGRPADLPGMIALSRVHFTLLIVTV